MLYSYISQFNWVDILLIALLLRFCYISLKKGLGVEIFKTVNLFFCAFAAFHFYSALAEFLNTKIPALPLEPAEIFSYVFLIFIITIIFRIFREAIFVFAKTESISTISKYTGLLLGCLRGVVIGGFIIFGLFISTIHYLELSAKTSCFGPKAVKIPIKIYEIIFKGAVANIFPDQTFNQKTITIIETKPSDK